MATNRPFNLIENYIYIYQLDKYVIIPTYPESLNDTLGSTFSQTSILARTAPIYSYSYSGPRSVQISISLHRDMMYDANIKNTQFLNAVEIGDDYVDTLVKYLQASALPSYNSNNNNSKMVTPPMVAIRFGSDMFIKGVINSSISVDKSGPITKNGKYQVINVSFNILEIDPQDAETISQWGSFRGLEKVLTRNLLGTTDLSSSSTINNRI